MCMCAIYVHILHQMCQVNHAHNFSQVRILLKFHGTLQQFDNHAFHYVCSDIIWLLDDNKINALIMWPKYADILSFVCVCMCGCVHTCRYAFIQFDFLVKVKRYKWVTSVTNMTITCIGEVSPHQLTSIAHYYICGVSPFSAWRVEYIQVEYKGRVYTGR